MSYFDSAVKYMNAAHVYKVQPVSALVINLNTGNTRVFWQLLSICIHHASAT